MIDFRTENTSLHQKSHDFRNEFLFSACFAPSAVSVLFSVCGSLPKWDCR